jgi:sialidase-1
VLIDPVSQASILTIGKKKGKAIIAFCNAADQKFRNNLTLRISFDDARTWSKSYKVDGNTNEPKGDPTAYSDLVKIAKKKIGVLYERNGYPEIVFTTVTWK